MSEYVHYTESMGMRVLSTKSRKSNLGGHDLAKVHRAMGEYLGREIVQFIRTEEIEFQHVQGVRTGPAVSEKSKCTIIPLLRAGLFAGLGIWDAIPSAVFLPIWASKKDFSWKSQIEMVPNLEGADVIIVDAVINTGESLMPVLEWVRGQKPFQLLVCSLVTPASTAERLAREHPKIQWVHARVSTNQYVGMGSTDTGNRLFNTKSN